MDFQPQNNPNNIQIQTLSSGPEIPSKKSGKILPVIVAVVVVVIVVVVLLSYTGYLKISSVKPSQSPYYSVSNVSQLASTAATLGSKSAAYNLSYSFSLGLDVNAGPVALDLNLPINGYEAHYLTDSKESTSINLLSLVNSLSSINKSLASEFPAYLDILNLSSFTNSTGGSLCIPFSLLVSAARAPASDIGAALNDSSATNSSLLCIYLPLKNAMYNYSAISSDLSNLSDILPEVNSNTTKNVSNEINRYLNVKFVKNTSYNGNPCALINIATSKDNISFNSQFCFSNTYGVPLNGSFVLNLTKVASNISSLLNKASSNVTASNMAITGSLSTSFRTPPSSLSAVSSLPAGSHVMNDTQLLDMISSVAPSTR